MDVYDPEHPSIFSPYKFIKLAKPVAYNLSRYMRYGDLYLVVNNKTVGVMSNVCNKIFTQSKLINGIISLKTTDGQCLGHLVLVYSFVHHFIPQTDDGFIIDETIYKRELLLNCNRVSIYG